MCWNLQLCKSNGLTVPPGAAPNFKEAPNTRWIIHSLPVLVNNLDLEKKYAVSRKLSRMIRLYIDLIHIQYGLKCVDSHCSGTTEEIQRTLRTFCVRRAQITLLSIRFKSCLVAPRRSSCSLMSVTCQRDGCLAFSWIASVLWAEFYATRTFTERQKCRIRHRPRRFVVRTQRRRTCVAKMHPAEIPECRFIWSEGNSAEHKRDRR